MLFYFDRLMEILLLPPGNSLLLAFFGFLAWRFWPKLGKFLVVISFIILWMLSTPIVAQQLINYLQNQYPPLLPYQLSQEPRSAIVVLEAGLNYNAPEYENINVSEITLTRLRYAAFLYQKMGTPILVSGSDPTHPSINQADYMADALKSYFNVPTEWKESHGFNTAQEAILSTEILKNAGVNKIYLVTHALHMPRSMYVFQHKGVAIIAAPTGFIKLEGHLGKISALLPTLTALSTSFVAMREFIGLAWYKLYYRF